MSLDVDLEGSSYTESCECSSCGNQHERTRRESFFSSNITHNLGVMAEAAGIYRHLWRPEEVGITRASQLIAPLESGLRLLRECPEKFKAYNPMNGWGSYEVLVRFVESYLAACREHPDAEVSVSR